jgi:hypothetical protein
LPTFQIFDQILSSAIAFSELRPGLPQRADLKVSVDRKGRGDDARTVWCCHYVNDGERSPWLSLGQATSGYVLRFRDIGDFRISQDCRGIHCSVQRNLPAETLRHVLLDQVIPLALAARGRTVLHAGAVLAPGGVIAFMGDSGAGKSTLVASFAMTGHPIFADDCLLVVDETPEAPQAVPSYPSVRLWPDALALVKASVPWDGVANRALKRRLGQSSGLGFALASAPLRAVYLLQSVDQDMAKPATVTSLPMSTSEAVLAFIQHAYRLAVRPGAPLVDEFTRLCRLAESVLVRRLLFSKHPDSIQMIRDVVDSDSH